MSLISETEKTASETEFYINILQYIRGMKLTGLISLLLYTITGFAQLTMPAGVANTYTLTEADGFPGFNYVNCYYQHPSGKIYAKDYFGNFHITGNNAYKTLSGLHNLPNGTAFLIPNNEELWLVDQQRVMVIKDDRLYKTIPFPAFEFMNAFHPFMRKAVIIRKIKTALEFYSLENYQWTLKNTVPWNDKIPINVQTPTTYIGNKLYLIADVGPGSYDFYEINTNDYTLSPPIRTANIKFYHFPKARNPLTLTLTNSFLYSLKNFLAKRTTAEFSENKVSAVEGGSLHNEYHSDLFVYKHGGWFEYAAYDAVGISPDVWAFESNDYLNNLFFNQFYPYATALMGNKPMRIFPYIKKFPKLYNGNQSQNIFTLAQDDRGSIWAGSYQGYLSIITPLKKDTTALLPDLYTMQFLGKQPYSFMNASLFYNGTMYFVGETLDGGIIKYDRQGKMQKVEPHTPMGFYLYYAPKGKKVYMPSAVGPEYPIYYCPIEELENNKVQWRKIGKEQGTTNTSFVSITEDTLGRLWMGHPKKGFAVYTPKNDRAIVYDTRLQQSPIGFVSCLTDKKGTVWMGSDDKGQWYYNNYQKSPTPDNLQQIDHPLLNSVKSISSMAVYKEWLVMGCYNRICLFNLDSFYLKKKTVVAYLNPQEAALTSFTEQNTMLVSHTDSSLWFSTSDMLYQWDLKKWLQLPKYKVNVHTYLQHDTSRMELQKEQIKVLSAGFNSFDISFEYLSPDALPRFTATALVSGGDSILFTEPSMQSKLSYKNLVSGLYTFYLKIFEQDGSTALYVYEFKIKKFIWQQWWFWLAMAMLLFAPFAIWLNARRKRALQDKAISQLNIVTLSNQFRPHFILNALNTIGADMKEKPVAESVISRLGESIDLIFRHTQERKISHPFSNEWKLVMNVIDIHQAMYIPDLAVALPGTEWLQSHAKLEIPMGIIEVIVENSLLHGLRNKKEPPYLLSISAVENIETIEFIIKDNGIGREKAKVLSSHRGHGKGIKNLNEIIDILNKYNSTKIAIVYEDSAEGTIANIKIPKLYKYEY